VQTFLLLKPRSILIGTTQISRFKGNYAHIIQLRQLFAPDVFDRSGTFGSESDAKENNANFSGTGITDPGYYSQAISF